MTVTIMTACWAASSFPLSIPDSIQFNSIVIVTDKEERAGMIQIFLDCL